MIEYKKEQFFLYLCLLIG